MKMENVIRKIVNNNYNSRAISFNDVALTYKELYERARFFAFRIQKILGKQKQPVMIYMNRSEKYIIAIVAVILSGNYFIPFEKDTPYKRILEIVKITKTSLICVDELFECQCDVNLMNMNEIIDDYDIYIDEVKLKGCNVVYNIFTSGSTGIPKGVEIQYSNLCNLILSLRDIVYGKLTHKINVALISSFSFDSSIKQIFGSLIYGHCLIISDKKDKFIGRKLVSFFNNNNIYLTDLTPSYLSIIERSKEKPKVEIYLIGGEKLYWKQVDSFYEYLGQNKKIINLYGPTECCVDVSYHVVDKK